MIYFCLLYINTTKNTFYHLLLCNIICLEHTAIIFTVTQMEHLKSNIYDKGHGPTKKVFIYELNLLINNKKQQNK